MAEVHKNDVAGPKPSFVRQVAAIEARKLKARRGPVPGVWAGLGTMGLIGWSVTIPTLPCVTLGVWLDHHYPSRHDWTLALLAVGLAIGCLNAWRWVANEIRSMQDDQAEGDE